jgi:lipid-binding SYLF domain-containing protein
MRATLKTRLVMLAICGLGVAAAPAAWSDDYASAITNFKHAGESQKFFHNSYAYALFPDVGEGGFIVGAKGGKGHVYHNGHVIGTSIMGGLSVGFQAGGKVFSEIIFFQDERSLKEFQSGQFEFAAGTSATAATANLGASAGTNGLEANASGTDQNANTVGRYEKGMAVFTLAKGGLMFSANVSGQHFSYKPVHGTDSKAAPATTTSTPAP